MVILFLLPFVFFLYYISGAGPEAFVGATFLLVPFSRVLLGYGISTPLFFLLSGVIFGLIGNNSHSLFLKEIFEVSTLFLAYAASFEFTGALRKVSLSNISKKVASEFIVSFLFFVPLFLFIKVNLSMSIVLSMLFLSISPITSMILLYEMKGIERADKNNIEGGIIIRDGIQIFLLVLFSHLLKGSHYGFIGLFESFLIAPFIGLFLLWGNKIKTKSNYLFLPVAIVLSIVLELYFNASSVFIMIFVGFWQRVYQKDTIQPFNIIDTGKILYPFVYTYTGGLILSFPLFAYMWAMVLLFLKTFAEYLAARLSGCRRALADVSAKIPMAGLSFHHLLLLKGAMKESIFSIIAVTLIASEFFAPLFLFVLKNERKKI